MLKEKVIFNAVKAKRCQYNSKTESSNFKIKKIHKCFMVFFLTVISRMMGCTQPSVQVNHQN